MFKYIKYRMGKGSINSNKKCVVCGRKIPKMRVDKHDFYLCWIYENKYYCLDCKHKIEDFNLCI